ncbi:MAG: uncharacterized protein V7608_4768, partial [Hyphomicrobiales bacterium]
AEISTGSGNDVIWVGVDSNGAGWTNHIKIDSGDGNDHITVALATHDYSASAFSAAYNPAWTTTEINGGAGDDVIEGGKSADVIDGGAGKDTVVLHGDRADYSVSTNSDITTIVDLRPPAANMDGTDHLIHVEVLQFDDQAAPVVPTEPGLYSAHETATGGTVAFTIIIADPAPAGGTLVGLETSPADGVTIPAAVTVPEGQTTATFTAAAQGVDFIVTAHVGAATYSSAVEIEDPPSLSFGDAGSIAFTGINSDGDNDIAFVALTDIAGNRTIEFGGAWSHGAFQHPEDHWSWTPPADGVAAGTVIRIDHIHSTGSISTNIGTVAGSGDLSSHDEAVFAYLSEITSDGLERHFLAGISNSTFQASGSNLTGTDLAPGANALEFGNHVDIAQYNWTNTPRSVEDYLARLTAPENWSSQSASGDQSHDGVSPDIPFRTTHFEFLV